jgi:guanylate kinase
MNSKIFVLCGFSASGKDTLLNELVKLLDVNEVVSFTSRPQRHNEVNGREYNFVDKSEFETMINTDEVVEYREYNTLVQGKKDVWYYGTSTRGIRDDIDNVVVLDTMGAEAIKKIYGDRAVVTFINVDDDEREARARTRGSFDTTEWQRRLEDDRSIFNSGVIQSFDYTVDNIQIDTSTQELLAIIEAH